MSTDYSQNALSTLAALYSKKPEVNSVWYNAKEVKLDGWKFISCRFDKCTLIATSTNIELINCFVSDDTMIQFGAEVAKPIRLYNCRNQHAYTNAPFFAPNRNPDGTLTITV